MSLTTIGIYLMLMFVYAMGVYEFTKIDINDFWSIILIKVASIMLLVMFLGRLIIATAANLNIKLF